MSDRIKIYFQKDTEPIITAILKDAQIEDSEKDFWEKMSLGKLSQGEVIFGAIDKIVLEKAPENDVCFFLKNELSINEEAAKKVYKDITTKLVPLINKQTPQEANKDKNSNIVKEPIPKRIASQKISEKTKSPLEAKKINTPNFPKQSSGPDRYREPIE